MTVLVDAPARGVAAAGRVSSPPGVKGALWRSLAVYRWVSMLYATVVAVRTADIATRPSLVWVLLAVMAAWTVVTSTLVPAADAWGARKLLAALVVVDVASCAGAVLATSLVADDPVQTLPASWSGGGVLAAALVGGPVGGLLGGMSVSAALVVERGNLSDSTLGTVVLLLLTGAVAGYLVRTAVAAETVLGQVLEERAADSERERIARDVHDGALQVLAYLAREAGRGLPAQRVAELAAEQESALRQLLSLRGAHSYPHRCPNPNPNPNPRPRPRRRHVHKPPGAANGRVPEVAGAATDLAAALTVLASRGAADGPAVTVSTPGMPVDLPGSHVGEIVAAVRAALDNVARHAGPGAAAWVLVEDEGTTVVVTVRDDGFGMLPGRVEQALQEGRLGLATSVRGRVRDLGGTVAVTSRPGLGTEVEIRVPRPAGRH